MRGWQGFSGLFLAGTMTLVPLTLARATEGEPWTYVRPEAIRSHVEFLASDQQIGRAHV